MTLFVDASAMVAIIAREHDAAIYRLRLSEDQERLTSALACWEAVLAVSRRLETTTAAARRAVDEFVDEAALVLVNVGKGEYAHALEAQRRFGKGNHPARLNLADCFAYACARTNDARLLYKGDDFAQTDLAWNADA